MTTTYDDDDDRKYLVGSNICHISHLEQIDVVYGFYVSIFYLNSNNGLIKRLSVDQFCWTVVQFRSKRVRLCIDRWQRPRLPDDVGCCNKLV